MTRLRIAWARVRQLSHCLRRLHRPVDVFDHRGRRLIVGCDCGRCFWRLRGGAS